MGGFRVLGDSAVHDILINLPRADIVGFRDTLAQCLVDFSTGPERQHQPAAAVVNRPEGQRCLFRLFTSAASVGAKLIVDPAPSSRAAGAGLHGILALCDQHGRPAGVLNAGEVTGYRTSLAALIPWLWRRRTDNVVVFGAGKQALWHLRLALALRGDEIRSVSVVNRSADRGRQLVEKLGRENSERWESGAALEYVDPSRPDYDAWLESRLAVADAVFCTVPSTEPLFPAKHVTGGQRERQPYVSAIGSWQPTMIELEPSLLHHVVGHPDLGFRWGGGPGGVVLVDDREGVLDHAGEVVESKLKAENLAEVGQVEELRRRGDNQELVRWLEDGLLVYKSVGVSMTDLAAGSAILALAEKRGVGVSIPEF
ncbi:putative ornithine cyclodeaminase [Diaporthe ampelina]|uniref:Putative ornithine cyclodeaminase n=1 Tax=Diaporthe ampelina TaxID=1214573 RepID=A0A0G2FU63_9PEZI|nr:putative ornithine cyclodeaminase [Diaporthe ampelina]